MFTWFRAAWAAFCYTESNVVSRFSHEKPRLGRRYLVTSSLVKGTDGRVQLLYGYRHGDGQAGVREESC